MRIAAITGTGIFAPEHVLTNDELVEAYNVYVSRQNIINETKILAGHVRPLKPMFSHYITKSSGIERRFVVNKSGILDPERLAPVLPPRSDDMPSLMAEMAVKAAKLALEQAGVCASQIDLVVCAASNMERAYPAIGVEVQQLLGAKGFAFDMNVACSSATFAIKTVSDMIRSGSIETALVVSPEICSAHLEWRDRDCNFIFGDVATAVLVQSDVKANARHFKIRSCHCETNFSNNIRNNNGFLRRAHDEMEDRRDMQFMQHGRKVFKEVLPIVINHINAHLSRESLTAESLKRLWLHQANSIMNEFVGKHVFNRVLTFSDVPNILQDYGNTSSAGSIVAFSSYSEDLEPGETGLICSFGAGYSVGSLIVERA
jgi:beta-ketodecanoyl-[acyl-carrier-protein] synthase